MKNIKVCLYALAAGILVTIITAVLGKAANTMTAYNKPHSKEYCTDNINCAIHNDVKKLTGSMTVQQTAQIYK